MGMIWGDDDRLLTGREEDLIRKVFRTTTLPAFGRIRIRNGLSPTGTPITTKGPAASGLYLIMVGQRLFDGDVASDEPSTLVHEMVHVWQYAHGTLTEAHALTAHLHYYFRGQIKGAAARLGNAMLPKGRQVPIGSNYEYNEGTAKLYERDPGESWDDMGFEGQAQVVEDWYSGGMSETSDEWVYVKEVLMSNDKAARRLTLGELRLRNPDAPSEPLDVKQVAFNEIVFSDAYLLDALGRDIPPGDVKGLAARVQHLELYCRQLRRVHVADAMTLASRFEEAKRGDQLGQAFHYRLSTVTRQRLINILRGLG